MINQENLNKLYEGVIDNKELATKELATYGFNSKDLAALIKQGKIKREKRGHYSFLAVDDLYSYGQKMICDKRFSKVNQCFETCYQLDHEHFETNYQLFYINICGKRYQSAFNYFDIIWNTDNKFYQHDNNYYLFLLSLVTDDIPDKYKEVLKTIRLEDILVDSEDKRFSDVSQENERRTYAYNSSYAKALWSYHDSKLFSDLIIRKLLFQRINLDKRGKITMLKLVTAKKYQDIIDFLENKKKSKKLSFNDKYVLRLATNIVEIQKTNKIPASSISFTKDTFAAIDDSNFYLALELSNNFNTKKGIDNKSSLINLLLRDICSLIEEIKLSSNKKVEVEKRAKSDIESLVERKDEKDRVDKSIESNAAPLTPENNIVSTTFSNIVMNLMLGNSCAATEMIRNYLDLINKRDYEYLIIDLVKLSIVKKDMTFTEPMIVLTMINKEDFTIDISEYLQKFYISIRERKLDEAKIYLDIIAKSNKIDRGVVVGLSQVLNIREEKANENRNVPTAPVSLDNSTPMLKQTLQPAKNSLGPLTGEAEKNNQPLSVTDNKNNTSTIDINEKERKFIEDKHRELLKSKGVILLKSMNESERQKLYKIVGGYDDMVAISLGAGKEKQVALKYKNKNYVEINAKEILRSGKEDYINGDYDNCIRKYSQVLQVIQKPKAFIFAVLGLAYFRKSYKNTTIAYLTIATAKSIYEEDGKFDFTGLITYLKYGKPREEIKPNFQVDIKDFEKECQYDFVKKDFENIKSYILETGLDVESACQNLKMSPEETDVVILSLAAEYYTQGDYRKGDEFLKAVEKSNNKTAKTKKLLQEVRCNKKFYANRSSGDMSYLSLTLQPRKK